MCTTELHSPYHSMNVFISQKQAVTFENDQNTVVPISVKYFETLNGQMEERRSILFNDTLNTFYLRLNGVGHMVKDHSDSERGNLLPPHRLLFPISNKGSFICIIPQTG